MIYNAVDISSRFIPPVSRDENYRKALGFSQTDIVVGQVGNLTANKRPDVLVRCFADTYEKNKNLQMVLVVDDPMRGELATI